MEQLIKFLQLFEIPGLILAAAVILLLFRMIDRIETDRMVTSTALLEIAKSFEKLSALIESLVRRQ